MASTAIEWSEMVWNPLVGCTPVSPGCLNCYAAKVSLRLRGMGKRGYRDGDVELRIDGKNPSPVGGDADILSPKGRGGEGVDDGLKARPTMTVRGRPIAERKNGRAVFTGSVRLVEEALTLPLRRRKPTVWFVNSMSDLFHEDVPFEVIDRIFAVMALCPHHTFMVLTKRPERMAEYVEWANVCGPWPHDRVDCIGARMNEMEGKPERDPRWVFLPLSNVLLGASVEDQPRADKRVPIVARLGAIGWRTMLSVEPLLEETQLGELRYPEIGWVIVGGESGPNARPCNVAWIRSIVRQCRDAGVPVFVKQLGARAIAEDGVDYRRALTIDGPVAMDNALGMDTVTVVGPKATVAMEVERVMIHADGRMGLRDPKGGDMSEWPEDLRVREMPERRNSESCATQKGSR